MVETCKFASRTQFSYLNSYWEPNIHSRWITFSIGWQKVSSWRLNFVNFYLKCRDRGLEFWIRRKRNHSTDSQSWLWIICGLWSRGRVICSWYIFLSHLNFSLIFEIINKIIYGFRSFLKAVLKSLQLLQNNRKSEISLK